LKIRIKNKFIGDDQPVFVVAEAGINHNGNIKIAKKMINEAQKIGADAIKFQTFKAEDLATPNSTFFKIFKKMELEISDFEELSDYAKSKEIIFCSTPFSEQAVDSLSKLKIPFFKISSGDLTHIPLLRYAATKRKPIIISTGMGNMDEIKNAVKTIEMENNKKIIIMHSISSYPPPPEDVNLNALKTLKNKFGYPIGFSDNGSDIIASSVAVVLGAKIIEKHFTINKKLSGPDQKISSDPKEFRLLIKNIRNIEKMMGDGEKKPQSSEKENRILARRSITSNEIIPKGIKIQKNMISIRRPAQGIEPKFIKKIIGKKTKKQILANTPITWDQLD